MEKPNNIGKPIYMSDIYRTEKIVTDKQDMDKRILIPLSEYILIGKTLEDLTHLKLELTDKALKG